MAKDSILELDHHVDECLAKDSTLWSDRCGNKYQEAKLLKSQHHKDQCLKTPIIVEAAHFGAPSHQHSSVTFT